MRVAHVCYFFDPDIPSPDDLLERYQTLTGVAEGIRRAGSDVVVVQRFHADATVERGGVEYRFVRDPCRRAGSLFDSAARVNRAAAACRPDLVHVHGLPFARQAARLRRLIDVPILIQDHANRPPARGIDAASLRRAFESIDMATFAAVEQAMPWGERGIIGSRPVIAELMEGSSRFHPMEQAIARRRTGRDGNPLCLWVGRLNANKDPLTALEGFALAAADLPNARLLMVYHESPLLRPVEEWLADHPRITNRIAMIGRVDHDELEWLCNSADLYLSASHREGSGYALLEALSCGLTPAVTDIPSFRVLTDNGRFGPLWTHGDPDSCARAILAANARRSPAARARIRDHFEENFSFDAIGARAVELYAGMVTHCRSRAFA
jgi:glycosyltransferase involved in cell wall biosynthesis